MKQVSWLIAMLFLSAVPCGFAQEEKASLEIYRYYYQTAEGLRGFPGPGWTEPDDKKWPDSFFVAKKPEIVVRRITKAYLQDYVRLETGRDTGLEAHRRAALFFELPRETIEDFQRLAEKDVTQRYAVLINGQPVGVSIGHGQTKNRGPGILTSWIKRKELPMVPIKLKAFLEKSGITLESRLPEIPPGSFGPGDRVSVDQAILQGIIKSPLELAVTSTNQSFFACEPITMMVKFSHVGYNVDLDQQGNLIMFKDSSDAWQLVKVQESPVLLRQVVIEKPQTHLFGRNEVLIRGKHLEKKLNLLRDLDMDTTMPGLFPLRLRSKIWSVMFSTRLEDSMFLAESNLLNLPILPFEADRFVMEKEVPLIRSEKWPHDKVRLGTYDSAEVGKWRLLVFEGETKPSRILRLGPPNETGEWSLAWDATTQEAHVLCKTENSTAYHWQTEPKATGISERKEIKSQNARLVTSAEGKVTLAGVE